MTTITGYTKTKLDQLLATLEGKVNRSGATAGQVPILQGDGTLTFGTVASGGGGTTLTPTAVKTAPYAVAVGELAMMNVPAGANALTLPTAPADKAQVGYRAIGATTAVPLVITAGGTNTIGTAGATSVSIPLADEVTVLQYQAASTRWLAVSNVKTQVALDARYAPVGALPATSQALPYGLAVGKGTCVVPVGVRGHAAFDNPIAIAAGATGAFVFEDFHPLTDPTVSTLVLAFGNWMGQNGYSNGDADASNPITIAAAVKCKDGTIVPFTFNGAHTATLTPGTVPLVYTDPLGFGEQVSTTDKFSATIPLTGVWIRVSVTPTGTTRQDSVGTTAASATVTDTSCVSTDAGKLVTGTGIPANTYVGTVTPGTSFTLVTAPGGSTAVNATATGTVTATITATIPANMAPFANSDTLTAQGAADLTLPGSGTVSGGSGSNHYGPVLVLGKPKTRKPIVALLSDSILDGYSEDFHSPYFGPVARACLQLGLPFVKLARGGETALTQSLPAGRRYRQTFLEGCTHAIVSYGTNDGLLTVAGEPANQTNLENRLLAIGNWLAGLGIKPYLATIPPRTTSTDAWATTTNQTPVSGSQIAPLAAVNQWVRAVPAPFVGIYDLAGDVMSATDSGLWAASATTDGVHPSDALMRGTISTNVKTLVSSFTLP